MGTHQFKLIYQKKNKKMPLWVSIENVASGLFVALSRAQNGAQLQLEREVREKEEQLWDYEEALTKGIFRNKTGLVADMKGSVGPELIGWSHHGDLTRGSPSRMSASSTPK